MQDHDVTIKQVVVDDASPTVTIIRRWRFKSNHRMDRCWLQGTLGDALHEQRIHAACS
ncbi:MAG: hypothetical protein Q7U28_05130 [Aquabacterium sp.]|nr:hypothetical protein [Aquabacterium sp.]